MGQPDRNIKAVITYEGTRYAGFQRQENGLTVQEVFENAILQLTGQTVKVIAAGRTDAGVHARGQVINFHCNTRLHPAQIQKALNHFLPEDVLAGEVEEAPPQFHARFSAKSKTYSYRIYHSQLRPVFQRNFVYHYRFPLQVDQMREAAETLVGTHDFRSFQATGTPVKNTMKTIHFCKVTTEDQEIRLEINGDGFLYHMVRNIAGTLILVGNGRITTEYFQDIIAAKDRARAGPTAPASGLCLEEVFY